MFRSAYDTRVCIALTRATVQAIVVATADEVEGDGRLLACRDGVSEGQARRTGSRALGSRRRAQFFDLAMHAVSRRNDPASVSRGPYAVEWETGNISSSHRALNKMALGLLKGRLAGGTLIVPSRRLYRYLTDRIGNFAELEPYLDLWSAIPCENGVLEIIVVEHDA